MFKDYNVALQRSQVFQMQFDTTDEFLYYTPSSRSEYSGKPIFDYYINFIFNLLIPSFDAKTALVS
jgi:hypothetical protein